MKEAKVWGDIESHYLEYGGNRMVPWHLLWTSSGSSLCAGREAYPLLCHCGCCNIWFHFLPRLQPSIYLPIPVSCDSRWIVAVGRAFRHLLSQWGKWLKLDPRTRWSQWEYSERITFSPGTQDIVQWKDLRSSLTQEDHADSSLAFPDSVVCGWQLFRETQVVNQQSRCPLSIIFENRLPERQETSSIGPGAEEFLWASNLCTTVLTSIPLCVRL